MVVVVGVFVLNGTYIFNCYLVCWGVPKFAITQHHDFIGPYGARCLFFIVSIFGCFAKATGRCYPFVLTSFCKQQLWRICCRPST